MTTPYHNQLRREQYRTGKRWRIVVDWNADLDADYQAVMFLYDAVGKGKISQFIREAVAEKIDREMGQGARQKTPQLAPAAQTDPIGREAVLALAHEVKRLQGLVVAAERPAAGGTHEGPKPTTPDQPAEQASCGIDMSGPRRRGSPPPVAASAGEAAAPRSATPPPANPALLLAASIRTASAQLAGHA